MNTELLTTGEAARRLGSSRQHVVDLCFRGDIEFVWVGKHRRVPAAEVDRLTAVHTYDRDAMRSLWLHRAVLGHLVRDPEGVLAGARAVLAQRLAAADYPGSPRAYYERWGAVLERGVEATARMLTDLTEEAAALRSSSPFVGVLSADERAEVLAAFRRHEAVRQ